MSKVAKVHIGCVCTAVLAGVYYSVYSVYSVYTRVRYRNYRNYCQKMTYSISVLFENWPTDAAGHRPRWNSETGKICVSHFFFPAGPGCIEKAVGRLKK